MVEDYAQENINIAMLELLKHTGRDKAVWIGMWEPSAMLTTLPTTNTYRPRLGLWRRLDFRRTLP